MEKLFYLQDSRSCTGNNVMFWRAGGAGYGTNLNELGIYTLEDAQKCHNNRNSDVPLLKSLVDELSISAVDCQVLPNSRTPDSNDEYVLQRKGYWNGNDILLVGVDGETYEYGKVKVFTREEAMEFALYDEGEYVIFSKSEIDAVSRRTFQVNNIDKKAMIKDAGIKLVKPKRVRPTTGKVRGNCPTCGKITWDFNPYENAPCSEHEG